MRERLGKVGRLAVIVILVLAARYGLAGEAPSTQPWEVVEVRMLRSQVERMQKELADTRAQNAELKARLLAAGIDPESGNNVPATQSSRPKRVVFVYDPQIRDSNDVIQAVEQLEPDQWFNVVVPHGRAVMPLSTLMLSATPQNREKVSAFLASESRVVSLVDVGAALAAAFRYRPDTICFVGQEFKESILDDVRRLNRGINAKVNTTTKYVANWATDKQRTLWLLAQETGGVCVDADGKSVPEPAAPVVLERPAAPPPAPRPSVFRVR